ncbi:hypothetical protein PV04_03265 [Phialophora macrospora]|uniref:Uncharacterized protein n=1 Tax=Phialophora macrospora TaxID=1851006 RepID=A0A0D2FX68_9EURO|nr:hypothetical protein PV04_03265 [Phialophora macrospora]
MSAPIPLTRRSPMVPSKSALRALRRLALSPSVLVVSTIGSVCGIATLNHEVNRKVHMAEQALESKRIIRSLSHGRGTAQLNNMIEAAERGEDFTLGTRGTKRRRRKPAATRSFSALALQEPFEHTDDHVPEGLPVQLEPQRTQLYRKFVPGRLTPRAERLSPAGTTRTQAVHSMTFEKILQASTTHPKVPHHRPLARSKPQQQIEAAKAKTILQPWLQPAEQLANGEEVPNEVPQPFAEARNSTPDIAVQYIEPEEQKAENSDGRDAQNPPLQGTPTDKVQFAPALLPVGSSVEPRLPQDNLRIVDVPDWASNDKSEVDVQVPVEVVQSDSSNIPGQPVRESPNMPGPKPSMLHFPKITATYLLACLDSDETMDHQLRIWINKVPPVEAETSIEVELAPAPKEFVDYATDKLANGTLSSLHRFMRNGKTSPERLSRRKWLAILRYYTSQHSLNWTMAEAVFYIYRAACRNPRNLNVRPVFVLIQHLLATVPSSKRIEQILFPISPDDTASTTEALEMPIRYLQFYCEGQHSSSECVLELGQILDVTRRCGLVPSKDLATPVLRALVQAGDIEMAEMVLERLTSEFGPSDSLALLEQYTFLNACEGNWVVVESMLDRFHTMNRSRSRPVECGRFFERLLLQHTAKNPSTQSFHFTVHTMKYAGLIPTNHVSRTLICAFIRDGRYDLVVEWLRLIKEAYPRVSAGFGLLQGAWLLTNTLAETGASCEEIAKVCQTIAHGHRKDPFGPAFREFAVDLVKADLSQRLCAVAAHFPSAEVSDEELRSMTMEQLLKYAYNFRTTPTTTGSNAAVVESLKNDLATQISAIVDLAKVFRGEIKMLFFGIKQQQDSLLRDRRRVDRVAQSPPVDIFPEPHRHGRSTGIRKLTAAVVQHYDRRDKEGLPCDHSILHHFITRFGPEYPSEVLELVEAVHASGFVQAQSGTPFDTELFKKWLYLVSTDGSAKSAVTALSAVSKSADRLAWTAHFRCLCEFVTQLGSVDNETLWDDKTFPTKPKEGSLRTFYEEIKERWFEQGSWKEERFRFPEWKGSDIDG